MSARLYSQYRDSFLQRAQSQNLDLVSYEHPELGPDGEKLFTDYALFHGPKNSPVLIYLSGLHGVEGYMGSLIQQKFLESFDFKNFPASVIFVHAVNAYGMAHYRRTNSSNVDLNRNCWTSERPIYNAEYLKFENYFQALKSGGSLKQAFEFLKLVPFILKHGMKKTTEVITGGQTVDPRGIFYAGETLQPELQSLLAHLQRFTQQDSELRVIDVHTGLGPFAHETLIVDGFDSSADVQFWSQHFKAKIADPSQDAKMYRAEGVLPLLIKRHWPRTRYIVEEFGTYSGSRVLQALVRLKPEQSLRAFFPDDSSWQNVCLQTGLQRFSQLANSVK